MTDDKARSVQIRDAELASGFVKMRNAFDAVCGRCLQLEKHIIEQAVEIEDLKRILIRYEGIIPEEKP